MNKSISIFIVLSLMSYSVGAQTETTETTESTTYTEETAAMPRADERSRGGAFVEPMLIYTQNETSIKTSQLPVLTDDTSGTVRDAAIGGRLGFHLGEIFFLAADGRYGRSRFEDSSYRTADSVMYNYGVTGGLQTPFAGIRVWGTSILGGEFDPQAGSQNVDVRFNDGRGYRVGAGLHIAAVSVNLEYQDLTYGNSEIQSIGDFNVNENTDVDMSQTGYSLSIGFPIEL